MNEASFHGLPLPLRVRPARPMTDEELMRFSAENKGRLRIEREPNGELSFITPAGYTTGQKNHELLLELGLWAREDKRGIVIESNTGITLPDGSMRSPDAAWISHERDRAILKEERERYAHVVPEFVVELISPSDRLPEVQAKMNEWMKNGVELGWILDPFEKTVHVYRQGVAPEVLTHISQVAGEGSVAGFVLPLDRIFR